MKLAVIALISCFFSAANALSAQNSGLFDIPEDEKYPDLAKLEKDYNTEYGDYQWHYDFSWLHPISFDSDFAADIKYFGSTEKRLKSKQEEEIYRMLKRMPEEYYPYIGPELHTIPGLSGKILDMPGIKETKNQFPKRIASQFSDIPNLEFISPSLYLYLMPEIWGEGLNTEENPRGVKKDALPARLPYIKRENIQEVFKLVPFQDFNKDKKNKSKGRRHFTASSSTPLSAADVEAFITTLDAVKQFGSEHKNKLQMIIYGQLISYWDKKNNGTDEQISLYRSMVNPCQSAIRRIKWAGRRGEFQRLIGKEGFGLDDWAQICDKTIKAYRLGNLTNAEATVLNLIKSGVIYKILANDDSTAYTPEEREKQKNFIEATRQTFSAPLENVMTVHPYQKQLQKHLREFNEDFLGSPLILP